MLYLHITSDIYQLAVRFTLVEDKTHNVYYLQAVRKHNYEYEKKKKTKHQVNIYININKHSSRNENCLYDKLLMHIGTITQF